jgi:hypothetical protein
LAAYLVVGQSKMKASQPWTSSVMASCLTTIGRRTFGGLPSMPSLAGLSCAGAVTGRVGLRLNFAGPKFPAFSSPYLM